MVKEIEIRNIFISSGHDFKGRHGKTRLVHRNEELESVECIAGQGLVGDRFFGHRENFKGQVTFLSREVIDGVWGALNLAEANPFAFRRNVIVSGVDLNALIGFRFDLNGLEFFGSEECAPCSWMNAAVGEGAESIMKNHGGLRCRILTSGILRKGLARLKILD